MLNASANGHTPTSRASALLNLNTLALPGVSPLPATPLDLASNAGALLRASAPYLGLLDAVDTASALGNGGAGDLGLNSLSPLGAPTDLLALLPLNVAGASLPTTLLNSLTSTDLPNLPGLPQATALLDVVGTLDTLSGALPVSTAPSLGLPVGGVGGLLTPLPPLPVLDTALANPLVTALGGAGGLLQAVPVDLASSALNLGQPSVQAHAGSAGAGASASTDTAGLGALLSIGSLATAEPLALLHSVVSQLKQLG